MESAEEYWTARALRDWKVEMGVSDTIAEDPIDRYALQAKTSSPKVSAPAASTAPVVAAKQDVDPVEIARGLAAKADSLDALKAAIAAFEHCELKRGSNNLVFADGSPSARVMVIGEASEREEDLQGLPFVGRTGQLLDKMFAAIGMARSAEGLAGIYVTNVIPWRPLQNREPKPEEIAMMRPFVERHIELAQPDLVVLMGNVACQAMLGRRGITRLRGNWQEVAKIPAVPMFHPSYLMRNPHAKREAWADLLMLQARLKELA